MVSIPYNQQIKRIPAMIAFKSFSLVILAARTKKRKWRLQGNELFASDHKDKKRGEGKQHMFYT